MDFTRDAGLFRFQLGLTADCAPLAAEKYRIACFDANWTSR